jgi:arylsulfatase A-like enzyme
MATFFAVGLCANLIYGLIDGLINLFGSSVFPLHMYRLGLETMARDLSEGLRWGVIFGLFFLCYGAAASRLTHNVRRAVVALLFGVGYWLLGAVVAVVKLMRSFGQNLPLPYQEHVTPRVFFMHFIGPLLTYSISMRPTHALMLLIMSFVAPAALGLLTLRLLGRRVGPTPLGFIPSLALTKKAAASVGIVLAAVVIVVLSPVFLGRPLNKPNVLLVSIDTLRADGLSCYGNPRPTSPNIDRLAADGTRYVDIFASVPWTLPSHVTMLTGLEPDVHGVNDLDRTIPRAAPLLAEIFQNAGYHTFAATSSFLVSPTFGFGRGFEDYLLYPEGRADQVRDMTFQLLAKTKRPWFIFVHFFDPHLPYSPTRDSKRELGIRGPDVEYVTARMTHLLYRFVDLLLGYNPRQRAAVRALYDGDVRDVDRALGQILNKIDLSNTLVFVTADHGEEFGEHGWSGHSVALYDESLRVPLIEHGPGVARGVVIDQLSDLTQLLPLIISRVGLRDPYGRNEPHFGQGAYASTHAFGNIRYSWRHDGWTFLTLNKFSYGLHNVEHPPGLFNAPAERDNLITRDPDRAARMQDEMDHFIGREIARYGRMKAGQSMIDQQRLNRLRELGYVNN